MRAVIGWLIARMGGVTFYALSIGMFVGWTWWMWMAIHFGSFGMFLFGLLGPLGIIAGGLGLWSLVFGIPLWLLHMVS
jgi:hypothetical protein